jgi:SLT domain-containing protein
VPEGVEIGKAYVTVNLDDQTASDYAQIRTNLERETPVTVKAKVVFDADPLEETRRQTRDAPPVEVPVKAKNPIDEAWRTQVQSSLKAVTGQSLKIPATPDTAEYRAQLVSTITSLQEQLKQEIPADLAEADRFKASVETLVRVTEEEVNLRIPVDVDTDSAVQHFQELSDTADEETQKTASSVNSLSRRAAIAFAAMFLGMPTAAVTATAATAAALGGMDAAFIAAGAAALRNNAQVSESWRGLGANLKSEAASWAQPLVQPFADSADEIQGTVDRLGPMIQAGFSSSVPAVGILTQSIDDFASRAMPGAVIATENATAPLLGLESASQQAGSGVTEFFLNLSQGAQSSQAVISTAGGMIRDFASFAGTLFANLTNNGGPSLNAFRGGLQQVEQTLLTITANGSAVYGFFNGFTSSVSGMLTVVRAAASVLSLLPNEVTGFAGSFTATSAIASKFGLDVGNAFSGIKQKIDDADGAGSKFRAGVSGLVEGALSPATLAVTGLSAVLMILGQHEQDVAAQTAAHTGRVQDLTAALQASNGAIDSNVTKTAAMALQDYDAGDGKRNLLADVNNLVGPQGVPLLTQAYLGNTDAQAQLAQQLQTTIAGHREQVNMLNAAKMPWDDHIKMIDGVVYSYDNTALSAQQLLNIIGAEGGTFQQASSNAGLLSQAINGVSAANVGAAVAGLTGTQAIQSQLSVSNAAAAISDRLQQAYQQEVQASQSVASAQHSLAQSGQAVTNAQHSVEQAQMGVASASQAVANAEHSVEQAQRSQQQALQGVTTAQRSYTQAQQDAVQAENDLNKAREQAVQDLKDLHLQLADQSVSVGQAQVSLFDAQNQAAGLGVTLANAQAVSSQQITTANEDQVKAALNLLSAQNQLNDAQNQNSKLQTQVNEADAAGVEGAAGVVAAKKALASANDQVTAAAQAVTQAQQQVTDANWNLQQADIGLANAHQGVRDAAWSLQQAELGVRDAQWSQNQAAIQLKTSQIALRQAQDAASTSLDTNTAAGRQNLAALMSLWDAIQKQGGPVQDQYKKLVDETAASFGWSADQADAYLKKLGLIPADFRYSVTAVGQVDLGAIGSAINSVAGQNFWHFADGGHVRGAGGPKDDKINAKLSNNEFVQPSDAVDHYGVGFMEAVRTKTYPKGGDGASLPGFATGGLVSMLDGEAQLAVTGTAYQSAVNALEVGGLPHPPGLPAYVPPDATTGAISYVAGSGVAQWAPQILQALSMLGQPASWLGTVERRMAQESGGNPNVVNKWDSNWAKGTPSVGLMQVIGPTFRSYAGQFGGTGPFSYGVSVDPLANIFAGLNYALHRYGSLSALNRPGGYDSGGFMLDNLALNSTGKPEMVLPPGLTDTMMSIHNMVQQQTRTTGGTAAGTQVSVNVSTAATDPYETAQATAREIAWVLR